MQDSRVQPGHTIQLKSYDVRLTTSNTVIIILRHSKTCPEVKGAIIILVLSCPICPIQHQHKFAILRLTAHSTFFIHLSGFPVIGYQAESVFMKAIRMQGLDTKIYYYIIAL